jgi:exosortase A-associated hydrolase 2
MKETPFFFGDDGRELFGVLHEAGRHPAGAPFVFCHPFAEEKLWTHRVFVHFARRLAAGGHPVLRFDFLGKGDSAGEFSGSSVSTMRADVARAVEEVRQRTGAGPVNLLGLRLGATIASLAAEEVPDIGHLILWAPIVHGDRYMQEMLRINVTTQMAVYREVRHDRVELVERMRLGHTVNLDGYEMAWPLYEEISQVRLSEGVKRHRGRCLIVQIDRQAGRPGPDLQALGAAYADSTLACAQEEPFWKEIARSYQRPAGNLFAVTFGWLSAPLVAGESATPVSG